MKLVTKLAVLFVLQIGFSGCAYIYSKSSDVGKIVEKLEIEQKYGVALDTLELITPDHPNYHFLMAEKTRLTLAARKFETDTIEKANQLEASEKWHESLVMYDDALVKLPKSKKLKTAKATLIRKRDEYLKRLEKKLLVTKAKTLTASTQATQEIARLAPGDAKTRHLLRTHNREVNLTAEKLLLCAQDALASHELRLAKECLNLAANLSPNPELKKRIHKLRTKFRAAESKRNRGHKNQIKRLKQKFDTIKNASELIPLQQQILALYEQDRTNRQIIQLKLKLDSRVKKIVNDALKQGREYYSKGKIQLALDNWKQVQPLDPDHPILNDYIHRAQRVLNKLHTLSEQQPNRISLPGGK